MSKAKMSKAADEKSEQVNQALMKLRFQNYNPRTEKLKKFREEGSDPRELLREITEAQAELLKSTNRKFGDPSLDLDNLIPRKGSWDMERALQPKLERLEKRTEKAILEIVKRKLGSELNREETLRRADISSDED